ncbi:styrene monooxygenase/indole monooxygenase family protein [Emcibacter nanhaiensis]|uniref:FAD-binding oxidoreductase n=1 Tax=Emcibacter nanhaiensis TaxID=1505037 RepID=A0A501PI71_9PROT|nr:styrene monooxygenase/indole monooxygenase family protein [Emcibacter nanhaiensis]TPD60183.1 FAD-binding oxidoreductase [Emcibacter nanhaiensis]
MKVTIIGAGQAGLQLGIGLLHSEIEVEIVSNRTGEEIRTGRIMSSQSMYQEALDHERELGLNFWDDEAPAYNNVNMMIGNSAKPMIDWHAPLDGAGNSIDQRVKMPRWMEEFEKLGGTLTILEAGIEHLEDYCSTSDLVIVASGKGEIGSLFEKDVEKCQFHQPMRGLSLVYFTGMEPYEHTPSLNINVNPGIGECVTFPGLTTSGACDIMTFEAVPGGEMDVWHEVKTPDQHLEMTKTLLDRFFPWLGERCRNIKLTDDNARLTGRFPPTVRKPIGYLPSGQIVLGIADAICLNDPITGQGSNNASKAAAIYLKRIVDNRGRAFDENWMQGTFDAYMDYAHWVIKFTNTFLTPLPDHIVEIFGAAQSNQAIGRIFAGAFNDPRRVDPWLYDPAEARKFIQAHSEAA